jgi:ABC-type sugar transport system ATPase subunit
MQHHVQSSIAVESISKSFGDTRAVHDLSLVIADGELCVLLGPSGCGKTTLIRLIAGLEIPDQGRVVVNGKDWSTVRPQERNIAMVFQHFALYPHRSVRGNIEYPLRLRRLAEAEIEKRVNRISLYLGIESLLERKPKELSGGEAQRVALARALVREPVSCFLMDEPLSNLDAQLRLRARVEIKRIQKDLKVTTIYVTHDQEEAFALADRIAIMDKGRLVQVGTAEEIFRQPGTVFVASFIGKPPMNLLRGTVASADCGTITANLDMVGGNTMPLRFDKDQPPEANIRVIVGIRPDDIFLAHPQDFDTTDIDQAISAEVELVEGVGPDFTAYCQTALGRVLVRTRSKPELGKAVIRLPVKNIHLFDEGTGNRIE